MEVITGNIASPKGFYADGLHCGLKKKKKDIGWIFSEKPAQAAAVYTTNQVKAAPIFVTKEALAQEQTLQAILVNSAVANACTGEQGLKDAYQMQQLAADKLGIEKHQVAVASTGVIGHLLPMDVVASGVDQLSSQTGNAQGFHEAILTTDIVTKELTVQAEIGGKVVTMSGVAKGSGMIHPNMATMLSFITTDVAISAEVLQTLLKEKVDQTYNQITVDGDTSTNDMVIVMANGCAGNETIVQGTSDYQIFSEMFYLVAETLAKKVARDGEGATKLIEVEVRGSDNVSAGRMMAKKVVGSSLVKSAIFGEDPNWGRIICAVGYAGSAFDPDKVAIWLGTEQVLQEGQPVSFDLEKMKTILAKDTVKITVDLNIGDQVGVAWGCDLTYKYVEINACYHT